MRAGSAENEQCEDMHGHDGDEDDNDVHTNGSRVQ